MLLKSPYTFKEAEELCNRYKHLIGKRLNPNGIEIGEIADLHTSPYNQSDLEKFSDNYSCELNTLMDEVFHQEFKTDVCDVLVFVCVDEHLKSSIGDFATQRLALFLQENLQLLAQGDTLSPSS